jgi:nucleoside-diphosphate kinase
MGKMNKTFTIIKPNATIANNIGNIINIIESNDYIVMNMKKLTLTREQASEFYKEHKDKSFFEGLIDFMTSAPIVVMELSKENAVEDFRKLIGNTNPELAEEGTIRKLYGKNVAENAIHASDSEESAIREISFFF